MRFLPYGFFTTSLTMFAFCAAGTLSFPAVAQPTLTMLAIVVVDGKPQVQSVARPTPGAGETAQP